MKEDFSGMVRIATRVKDLAKTNKLEIHGCEHISEINEVKPSDKGCRKCLAMGDTWVTLRLCLTCGHVGCCDDSKNKHASKHYVETSHPMMASYEIEEEWLWCYVDEVVITP